MYTFVPREPPTSELPAERAEEQRVPYDDNVDDDEDDDSMLLNNRFG